MSQINTCEYKIFNYDDEWENSHWFFPNFLYNFDIIYNNNQKEEINNSINNNNSFEQKEEISINKKYFISTKRKRIHKRLINNLINKKLKNNTPNCSENPNKKEKNLKKKENIKIKVHTATDDDNILRKIQVHFMSFIVNYTNDVIDFLINDDNKPHFNHLDYRLKKIVKHSYVEELKEKSIGDILRFDITPKMKKRNKTDNKHICEEIIKRYPSFQKFFEKNYLTLFKEYYYTNEKNTFEFNGHIIPLSEKTKTKTFSNLIKRYNSYKEKIIYVSVNYYLNNYKRIKKSNFQIITN